MRRPHAGVFKDAGRRGFVSEKVGRRRGRCGEVKRIGSDRIRKGVCGPGGSGP
ncbi:hypothetical protein HMPREF9440_01642 [Sutterella parvirubra YIT 11816]|uniref:Uncharacterized protein n=1 Tax=Sutterella parvirubra YIT 11816 TaxID=762967 RepID=H3KFX0_9BURK|nr:hypothetical protein HMPREF9440_01642 [Sutterella parvirubra YIT 11816]